MIKKTEQERFLFTGSRSCLRVVRVTSLYSSQEKFMLPSGSSAFCLLSLFGVSGSMLALGQSSPVEASSPNHQIAVHFRVQTGDGMQAGGSDGQLVYSVTFHGKQVFEDSALRLEMENQTPLGANVQITSFATGSDTDDYSLLAGKTSAVHDPYNSLRVQVRERPAQAAHSRSRRESTTGGWRFGITSQNNPGSHGIV